VVGGAPPVGLGHDHLAFRAEQDPLERVREVRLLYGAVVPSRRGQRRLVDEVREVGSELGESCVAAMQLAGEYAPLYQSGQQKPRISGDFEAL
jgi:hypothetical protein